MWACAKADLVERIFEAAAKAEGFRPVTGILEIQPEGYGFIRTGNYMQGDDDAFVFQQMVKQNGPQGPGDEGLRNRGSEPQQLEIPAPHLHRHC
jgi:transcription termination factor Rho